MPKLLWCLFALYATDVAALRHVTRVGSDVRSALQQFETCVSEHGTGKFRLPHAREDEISREDLIKFGRCAVDLHEHHRATEVSRDSGRRSQNSSGFGHITMVRHFTPASRIAEVVAQFDPRYNITVYDTRETQDGVDGFGQKMKELNSRINVQKLPDRGDESFGYLERIVNHYDELSTLEIFLHEVTEYPKMYIEEKWLMDFKTEPKIWYAANRSAYSKRSRYFLPFSQRMITIPAPRMVKHESKFMKWGGVLWTPCAIDLVASLIGSADDMEMTGNSAQTGTWSSQPGAEFVAKAGTIRMRSLTQWSFLRSLVNGELDKQCGLGGRGRAYKYFTHVYERMWGFFMGQPTGGTKWGNLYQRAWQK